MNTQGIKVKFSSIQQQKSHQKRIREHKFRLAKIEKLQQRISLLEQEQHKAELAKYRNGYMAEIDKAIKRTEVAERKIIAHEATIEKQKQRIDTLDRRANPHRYCLSSDATLIGIRMSPRHSNIPSLRIQTKVENEIFEPFEQVSQVQAQLLGATFEMLSGGPVQTHVGTGGGGSSSDMPWGEKKSDSNTSRMRR